MASSGQFQNSQFRFFKAPQNRATSLRSTIVRNGQGTVGGPEWTKMDLFRPGPTAYSIYYMYAALNIDVASLLGVSEEKLTGSWAQVNMIQRDACIQSCSMLGWKSYDNLQFEQICMHMAILPLLTLQETISVTRQGTSRKGHCPVPHCRFCGKLLGEKTTGTRISDVISAAWAHMQSFMEWKIVHLEQGCRGISPRS